ncbi:MAG TPA: cytochrome c [Gemmatimonadales bacterium]|nr:cytochrome c [Gemmatimonadales bacterium]
MTIRNHLSLAAFALLLATACQPQGENESQSVPQDSSAMASGTDAAMEEHDEHAAAEGEGEALLPIMQRLGSEMLKLTHALMTDDTATVAASAEAVAAHVPISSAELARIRAELGNQMAAFEALDESVHVASTQLSVAARSGNMQEVLQQLNIVQAGCVSCHSQFRERLRTGTGEMQPQ